MSIRRRLTTVVGDGSMRTKWETLARLLSLAEQVRFTGNLPWYAAWRDCPPAGPFTTPKIDAMRVANFFAAPAFIGDRHAA